jgi:hypothetical protein
VERHGVDDGLYGVDMNYSPGILGDNMNYSPPPATVLEEASTLTSGPRQRDYDHPRPNHQRIAALWNAYRTIRKHPEADLDGEDVARMMILLKIARDVFTPKRDNLTDICGYARCLEKMRDEPT